MGIKRLVAVFVVITLLAVGTVSPAPARASTSDILIYTGVAIVGWVAILIVGTQLAYGRTLGLTEAPVDLRHNGKHPPKAIRFGTECQPTSTEMTPLMCW